MPAKRSTPKMMHRAGELHKVSTPAEKKLWAYLRGNKLDGVNFRRQHAIGNYIADFVAIKKKLIIELDGGQHLQQEKYDDERTMYFEALGYKVIRFWNDAVMNDINRVIRAIQIELKERQIPVSGVICMNPLALITINLALLFYSIGVWSERIQGRLKA